MPTRFRRTIQIMPGVKVNLSKGGMSFSLGRRGFTINVGKNGVRRTVGIPGTGISNTEYISKKDADDETGERGQAEKEGGLLGGMGTLAGMAAVGALAEDEHQKSKSEQPSRKRAKPARKTRTRSARSADKDAGHISRAVRGLVIFAAIALVVYLGSVVIPRLPPNWPSDLSHSIMQWAVQFGH